MSFRFWIIVIACVAATGWIVDWRQEKEAEAVFLESRAQKRVCLAPKDPPKSLAKDAELIYLSTYAANEKEDVGDGEGIGNGVGVINVKIDRPQSKVVLMLYGNQKVRWRVSATPGTVIAGIVASGSAASSSELPEVMSALATPGYYTELPVSFEVENVAFKAVEARVNQLFGVNRLDVYRGSYGMVGRIVISALNPVSFGPIDSKFLANSAPRDTWRDQWLNQLYQHCKAS